MSDSPYPTNRLARRFHLYERGIHTASLSVTDTAMTITRRDRQTDAWSEPEQVTVADLLSDERRLPGGLRVLPALWEPIEATDWGGRDGVTLPVTDAAERVFIRRRDLQDGHTYWAQDGGGLLRDGMPPLDLVIGPDGQFVSAIDGSLDFVLVQRGAEQLTHLPGWDAVSPARWGYRQYREMVPMADDVRLATDVYLPDGDDAPQQCPAILLRTPYNIELAPLGPLPLWEYCARGYAVVLQDVRGRWSSEGTWDYILREPEDGDRAISWVAEQPWCDGNVGMMGASYPGHCQWMAAMEGNPHLKAMIPVVSMGTPHNDMPYTGGAFTAGAAAWCFFMEGGNRERDDWAELLVRRPFGEVAAVALGKPSPLWDLQMSRTLYDDDWKAVDWLRHADQIDVPALQISGWYDDDLPGTLHNWAMMARNQRAHQRLILGGWRHGINQDREINGVHFGPDVIRPDVVLQMQRWYDRFLKGIDNGVEREPAVHYFSTGDDAWRTATAWPPAEAIPTPWYLRADGHLSPIAPSDEPPSQYVYDPADPAPSRILRHLHLNEQALPDDYCEVEARDDVLTFTSDELPDDLTIAGNISAVLFAASSAVDTDWIVRLTDVLPDGRSIRLVEGVIRARHRATFEEEQLLTPGQVERYEIAMRAHANTFKRGHRIRLNVCSAAAGYIFPNSNTGDNEATVTRTIVAEQTIYHDAERASHVLLPVLHSRTGPAGQLAPSTNAVY